MAKRVFAVFIGFVAGFIIVSLLQLIASNMYPPPPDLLPQDSEGLANYFSDLPSKARWIIISAHALGALFGSFLTSKMANKYKSYLGYLTGFMLLAASISYDLATLMPINLLCIDVLLLAFMSYLGVLRGSS